MTTSKDDDLQATIARWRNAIGLCGYGIYRIDRVDLLALLDAAERAQAMHYAEARRIRNAALEEAALVALHACLVPPDGGSPTAEESAVCEEAARRIRALKEPTP